MQIELDTEFPTLDFQLLGVNALGQEAGLPTATQDRSIPMLQDVDSNGDNAGDVWGLWNVEWRDLVILDANNRKVGVINLTTNDLAEAANYQAVKQMLLDAADLTDQPGSISGYAFIDANQNGVRDSVESPLGNVQIMLSGTDLAGQSIQRTVSTGADGLYQIASVPAGTYTVQESQPVLLLDGRDSVGTVGGTSADDRFSFTLAAGVHAQNYNFGERGRSAATISLFDFFTSTPRDGAVVASQAGALSWFALEGAWSDEASDTDVAIDAGAVHVLRTDSVGNHWEGHYPVSNRSVVQNLFQQSALQVMRVGGSLSPLASEAEVGTAPTVATHAGDGEGEPASVLAFRVAGDDWVEMTAARWTVSAEAGSGVGSAVTTGLTVHEPVLCRDVVVHDAQQTAFAEGPILMAPRVLPAPVSNVQSAGTTGVNRVSRLPMDRQGLLERELAFACEDLLE